MKSVLLGFAAAAAFATSASAMPAGLLSNSQTISLDGVTITWSDVASAGAGAIASVVPIPEPGTWALMLVGVGGLGAMLRMRRKSAGALA